MKQAYNLERFLEAQETQFEDALQELKNGRKRSHWMWYMFPQISGLGFSSTSMYYGIKDLGEAQAYFNHQVLGKRLLALVEVVLKQPENNATAIFGSPDDVKLKSSMTLFAALPESNPAFKQVLEKYFNGQDDEKTLKLIAAK
jgi:uncharacterized protein (DUF1810 family)